MDNLTFEYFCFTYRLLELRTNGLAVWLINIKCACIFILFVFLLEIKTTPTEKQFNVFELLKLRLLPKNQNPWIQALHKLILNPSVNLRDSLVIFEIYNMFGHVSLHQTI